MKPISTRTHGIIDWATAGTTWLLPRIMGWSDNVKACHAAVGCATATNSVFTDYELGIFRILPMKAHLTLDAIVGALCCSAPLFLSKKDRRDPLVTASFLAVGALEIASAFLTQTEPSFERRERAPTLEQQPRIRGLNQPEIPSVPSAATGEKIDETVLEEITDRLEGVRARASTP